MRKGRQPGAHGGWAGRDNERLHNGFARIVATFDRDAPGERFAPQVKEQAPDAQVTRWQPVAGTKDWTAFGGAVRQALPLKANAQPPLSILRVLPGGFFIANVCQP